MLRLAMNLWTQSLYLLFTVINNIGGTGVKEQYGPSRSHPDTPIPPMPRLLREWLHHLNRALPGSSIISGSIEHLTTSRFRKLALFLLPSFVTESEGAKTT